LRYALLRVLRALALNFDGADVLPHAKETPKPHPNDFFATTLAADLGAAHLIPWRHGNSGAYA